jgi:F0F1-type ATP synthase membrane subunit c/vacuolar-type H+-ATPase subunit K
LPRSPNSARPRAILLVAIPETMVILGFVVAVLIMHRAGG